MSSDALVVPESQKNVASVEAQPGLENYQSSSQRGAARSAAASKMEDWLTLTLLPGCGVGAIGRLVDHFGSPAAALSATRLQWSEVSGLGEKQLKGFESIQECRARAISVAASAAAMGVVLLSIDDPAYPALLNEIPDPPVVLYCLGDMSLLDSTSVAMVGSRSATSYGRRVARTFAEGLSRDGVTIVSGMALGIDSEAHIGGLQAKGSTIGVLGCGIDVLYPRQNGPLFEQVKRKGLLISEYSPGTRPEGFRFPARNRIIAGLSRGVVVVEAARRSGSLITAQLGLDFCREIFAVPGQVDSYKSEGAHWLLQQGAQLVMSPADIAAGISMDYGVVAAPAPAETAVDLSRLVSGLEPEAVELLEQLEPYPVSREEIAIKVDMSQARLSELFLYLELEGVVEIGPGDMVRRTI